MLGITPVLVACSSAEDRRNAALDGVTDMVEDAQKRINQVQSGVNMLLQGKELIESGVTGEQ